MLKWISPIITRFKVAPRPHLFSVNGSAASRSAASDEPTAGQKAAERVAAFVGSWAFLGGQAFLLLLWLVYNTLQFTTRFDPPPYILLNLLLSFQAAFTGPVLLIAANVGAMRDHKQADRIEALDQQGDKLAEQVTQLVEQLVSMDQLLSDHVHNTLREHSTQLAELRELLTAVHACVVTPDGATPVAATPPAATSTSPATETDPATKAPSDAPSARPQGKGKGPQPRP
jgi:uncharacterized membrane protein